MENKTKSRQLILNYGVYLGLIGVLIHLTFFATGKLIELSWLSGTLGFIAMIIFIVLGIKKFKKENDGFLSFGQALKIGVGMAVVSAVITILYTFLFTNVIDPTFQERAMEAQTQAWLDNGMTEEQVEQSLEVAKKFQTPLITSAMSILFAAFFGFIFSAITGAILKKTPEEHY